jgi:hypothetical protein
MSLRGSLLKLQLVFKKKSGWFVPPGFMLHLRRKTRLARKGVNHHLIPQAAAPGGEFW